MPITKYLSEVKQRLSLHHNRTGPMSWDDYEKFKAARSSAPSDLTKLIQICEVLVEAHSAIANFKPGSIDKIALLQQADGYQECSRRALDKVNKIAGES